MSVSAPKRKALFRPMIEAKVNVGDEDFLNERLTSPARKRIKGKERQKIKDDENRKDWMSKGA